MEFAADRFGTRLVVVLGHSQCGAVTATLEEALRPAESQSRNLRSIVDRIRPSVLDLLETEPVRDPDTFMREAIRANVRAAANQLRHGSPLIERLSEDGAGRGRGVLAGERHRPRDRRPGMKHRPRGRGHRNSFRNELLQVVLEPASS